MSEKQPEEGLASPQPPNSEHPTDDEPFFPDLKLGDAWGESITKKRAAGLEASLQAWNAEKEHGERKGPFDWALGDVPRKWLTGADVFWLAERSGRDSSGAVPHLHLEGAFLREARLERANLARAHLEGTDLELAHLDGADLTDAHLRYADLRKAHLEGTSLHRTRLEGADLARANLSGADLHGAYLSTGTYLNYIQLGDARLGGITVRDVRWGDVNLAVVEDWTQTRRRFLHLHERIEVIELGEERQARSAKDMNRTRKNKGVRLREYKDAVRANRQLATVLRQQGLNEDADRFAYKAQKLQREVLRRRRRYGAALGSWLLDMIAGYGYRPMRSVFTYAFVVLAFAAAYFVIAPQVGIEMPPLAALVFSVTSFHGRGFTPGENVQLTNSLTVLAAGEAIIGLLIEIVFIATFTQRFFAR